MAVTAESHSQFLAFRRLIYSLSRQLSDSEAQAIVYIHFFDHKDTLKSVSSLEVLCKLESHGVATASNPEKLLELMKDLKRNDLVSEVKDFLKKKKSKSTDRRRSSPGRKSKSSEAEDVDSEDDLELRSTLEAAIVQATVLLQHVELIQSSISSPGTRSRRGQIRKAVNEAAQTSEALAERLRRAEVKMNQDHQWLSSGSDSGRLTSSDPNDPNSYINMAGSALFKESQGKGMDNGGHIINRTHDTDRYSTVCSSVPSRISDYHPSAPGGKKMGALLEKSAERAATGVGEEDEDDDYEHMNPHALLPEDWAEVKRTILGGGGGGGGAGNYSVPRPQTTKTGADLSSVAYSSLKLPSSSATTGGQPVTTNSNTGTPEMRLRADLAAGGGRKPSPHTKRTLGSSKSDAFSRPLSHISVEGGTHRQRSTHISLTGGRKSAFVGSPPTQAPPTDNNYTTLHLTAKGEDDERHFYKPLDRSFISPPGEYTAVQHQDYK